MAQIPMILLLTAEDYNSLKQHLANTYSPPATLSAEDYHLQTQANEVLNKLGFTIPESHAYSDNEMDSIIIGLFKTHPELKDRIAKAFDSNNQEELAKRDAALAKLAKDFEKSGGYTKDLEAKVAVLETEVKEYEEMLGANASKTASNELDSADSGDKVEEKAENTTTTSKSTATASKSTNSKSSK